jgi:hypothetical protein
MFSSCAEDYMKNPTWARMNLSDKEFKQILNDKDVEEVLKRFGSYLANRKCELKRCEIRMMNANYIARTINTYAQHLQETDIDKKRKFIFLVTKHIFGGQFEKLFREKTIPKSEALIAMDKATEKVLTEDLRYKICMYL